MVSRRISFALFILAGFLAVPLPVHALDATPAASGLPTPPGQPTAGPGGAEHPFSGVRVTVLGDEPGGGRIFEPTTVTADGSATAMGPRPLVLLIDGCCYRANDGAGANGGGSDGGQGFQAWITHLVRRGAIVVYPTYGASTASADIATAMRTALTTLASRGHAQPDPARTAVIGFSFGGPLAADYAAGASGAGLPVPKALLVYGPIRIYPAPNRPPPPSNLRSLVLVGDDDPGAEPGAKAIWTWLAPLPARQREFVTLVSDDHGQPSLIADHLVPLTDPRAPNPRVSLDALDWYGTWKLTDALMACAFAGQWCEVAFGNTPEQRFMGTWSDGVAVKELVVTDNPPP